MKAVNQRQRSIVGLAFLLLAVITFAGCADFLAPVNNKQDPPSGMGYVNVALDYRAPRTLMPSMPDFSKYVVLFTTPGKANVEETFPTDSFPLIALEPATWSITVTAYQSIVINSQPKEVEAARGTGIVIVQEGLTSAPVIITLNSVLPLTPDLGLTGVFSYNISGTVTGAITGEFTLKSKNNQYTYLVSFDSLPKIGSMEVPAGEYDLSLKLTNSAGMKATRYAAVHIYAGLETTTDDADEDDPSFAFTDADFAAYIMLGGTLSIIKPIAVTLADPSVTITASYSAGFSPLIASTTYPWTTSQDTWFLDLPAISPLPPVYLKAEVTANDGKGSFTYVYQKETPITGIPDNGMSGIPLGMNFFGITDSSSAGGSITTSRNAAVAGTLITFTPDHAVGNYLVPGSVRASYGANVNIPLAVDGDQYSFVMPSADVTITANFQSTTVTVSGSLAIPTIPPGVNLTGKEVNITAYRDQGRFSSVGTASGIWPLSGTLSWAIQAVPFDVGSVYLTVQVAGDDDYVYEYRPSTAASVHQVNGNTGVSITMPIYGITVSPSITGGSVTASRPAANPGEKITLGITPVTGYSLVSITVSDGGDTVPHSLAGAEYSFIMPQGAVTITAVFSSQLPLSGTLTVTKPGNVVLGAGSTVSVSAYGDPGRSSPPIASAVCSGTWEDVTTFEGTWNMQVPVSNHYVYLSVEVTANTGSGNDAYVYHHPLPVVLGLYASDPSITDFTMCIYEINTDPLTGGSINIKSAKSGIVRTAAAPGEEIELLLVPTAPGFNFKPGSLSVNDGALPVPVYVTGADNTFYFVMPSSSVTLYAEFE